MRRGVEAEHHACRALEDSSLAATSTGPDAGSQLTV